MTETFDTLAAARQLQAAGMERPHAEAVADVVRDSRDGLATKADIAILSERIKGLSTRIGTLQWVAGLNVAMTMAILVVMLVQAFSL